MRQKEKDEREYKLKIETAQLEKDKAEALLQIEKQRLEREIQLRKESGENNLRLKQIEYAHEVLEMKPNQGGMYCRI